MSTNKNITKADLVAEIASRTGYSRVIVQEILDEFFQVVRESIINSLAVQVRGFGTFFRKRKASKKARNIGTGVTIEIPEHDVAFFKPSKSFQSDIKNCNIK